MSVATHPCATHVVRTPRGGYKPPGRGQGQRGHPPHGVQALNSHEVQTNTRMVSTTTRHPGGGFSPPAMLGCDQPRESRVHGVAPGVHRVRARRPICPAVRK